MPTVLKVMSWNIQILGETKVQRDFLTDLLGLFITGIGPDIVAIQELVYAHATEVTDRLMADLKIRKQTDWSHAVVQANNSGDRDGYLFLWRNSKLRQLTTTNLVQGVFAGNFPNNIVARGGRRVGYVGLTLADGSHPFIVANYHGPTYESRSNGSAPATGVVAIKDAADQLHQYATGHGMANYEGWLLCGDFNLDITADNNLVDFYQPMMAATQTQNITTSRTILYPVNEVPSPRPDTSAGYLSRNLDNIFAGPPGRTAHSGIVNPVDLAQDKEISRIFESYGITNDSKFMWDPGNLHSRFSYVRTYMSDHVPLVTDFTLVP